MARWITFTKVPFDYFHSRASATQYSELGEFFVPDAIADRAIAKGYATEGKAPGSTKRSTKSGPKQVRRRRKAATPKADAATDTRANASLAGKGLVADDSATVRSAVDQAAEQR